MRWPVEAWAAALPCGEQKVFTPNNSAEINPEVNAHRARQRGQPFMCQP